MSKRVRGTEAGGPSRRTQKSQKAAVEQLRGQEQIQRVLAFGDSLTNGYVPCEPGCARDRCARCQRKPWAPVLQAALVGAQALGSDAQVVHEGKEGWTTTMHVTKLTRGEGLRGLLLEAQAKGTPFGAVLVMSGANDLADDQASAEAIVANLAVLHDEAHAFGARSVAIAIPESSGWSDDPEMGARGKDTNERLRRWCCDERRRDSTLCIKAPLGHSTGAKWYSSDGLHLTAEGYTRFGELLAADSELQAFLRQ